MTLISINKYDLPTYLERLKRNGKEDTSEERLYYLERRESTRRKTRNGYLRHLEELTPINKSYATLAWALLSFKPDHDQNAITGSLEEQKEFLRRLIVTGYLQIDKLTDQYNNSISSNSFKWMDFFQANEIPIPPEIKNDDEIKEHVKSLLSEFINQSSSK